MAERHGTLHRLAWARTVLAVAMLATVTAGCAVPRSVPAVAHVSPPTDSPVTITVHGGGTVSATARMICSTDAEFEIRAALATTPTSLLGTASDHAFSCRYVYPVGAMVLTVTELADAPATTAYFASARNATPGPASLDGLGDAAFAASDGSVFVRKDFKVLHVDVSGLPEPFGPSHLPRAETAFRVAAVIMACWTGS